MSFPFLKEVEAYWQGLCPIGDIPHRSAIEPRGIERALDHTFILTRVVPRVARLRLSCRHLNDLMGMDTRGMPFTSFFEAPARARITDLVEALFLKPQIVHLTLQGPGIGPGHKSHAEAVLLPMRDNNGEINRALGCLVSDAAIDTVPLRFRIKSAQARRVKIAGWNQPSPDHALASGFAEPAVVFVNKIARNATTAAANEKGPNTEPGKKPNGGHPVLRLVKSDKGRNQP